MVRYQLREPVAPPCPDGDRPCVELRRALGAPEALAASALTMWGVGAEGRMRLNRSNVHEPSAHVSWPDLGDA